MPGDTAEPPRVGCTIGRKVGSAVVRNRLRRRLRMIMRDFAAARRLSPGAYLISVGPEAARLSYPALTGLVGQALEGLA